MPPSLGRRRRGHRMEPASCESSKQTATINIGFTTMLAKDSACETPWFGLFERLIDKIGTRRGDQMPGQPGTNRLPSSVYTDPVRYEAELTYLFRRMPLCLGPVDQLGEGGNV